MLANLSETRSSSTPETVVLQCLDTKLGETPNVDAQNKNAASERT